MTPELLLSPISPCALNAGIRGRTKLVLIVLDLTFSTRRLDYHSTSLSILRLETNDPAPLTTSNPVTTNGAAVTGEDRGEPSGSLLKHFNGTRQSKRLRESKNSSQKCKIQVQKTTNVREMKITVSAIPFLRLGRCLISLLSIAPEAA